MGSVNHAIDARIDEYVGRADARIRSGGKNGLIDASLLDAAARWPEPAVVAPRLAQPISLRFVRPVWKELAGAWPRSVETYLASGLVTGVSPDPTLHARPVRLLRGRLPVAEREIVLDQEFVHRLSARSESFRLGDTGLALLARAAANEPMKADPGPESAASADQARDLNARGVLDVGDAVEMVWYQRAPRRLEIVGIAPSPPLGGTPQAWMTVDAVAAATDTVGKLSEIDLILRPGADANAFVAARKAAMPDGVMLQTTERITSGLQKNLGSNRMGYWVASLMAFICGAFIIMTGMSTGVTERHRELGILRCIGAAKGQLARSQIAYGLIVGAAGAAVGVPLGVAAAWFMLDHYQDKIGAGPVVVWWRVAWAAGGSILTGVLGALWPAWQAARTSPLQAMAVRAAPARRRTILIITVLGVIGVAIHLGMFFVFHDPRWIFWVYFSLGLPGVMLGYFLLGVPCVLLAARLLGPIIDRVLVLPRGMLRRTIEATPYRFGFTSGAMMAGLGLMVAVWTQGSAVLRDWIDQIQFPDAFVAGLNMTPESQRLLDELPFVKATSSIAIQPVDTDGFGIKGMTALKTNFVAFEPTSFFKMTRLNWVQGDVETATRRLEAGGAVIVAREFLTAKGLGVGGTFVCRHEGKEHSFEIVGVVTSPGLEMVGNMFDVGDGFIEQSVHAVFGSRRDLKDKFHSDAVQMIQISLDPAVPDAEALSGIRARLISAGALAAGSGREIKSQIKAFVGTALFIVTAVGAFAMFVGCFGVANLIVAGVQARRFEFGVLLAVGATRGTLTRLVLGEAVVIAAVACLLGTMMGVQGAFAGNRIDRALWGLDVTPSPPPLPILGGWALVFAMTCGAAAPAVAALARRRPRELLAAVRG